MPELPEVEIIKLNLQGRIIGKRVKKIQILSTKSFIGNPNEVEGKKVVGIWRRAKLLGIELKDVLLLFHLKMSGQLIYEDGNPSTSSASFDKTQDRLLRAGRFIGGHPTQDMVGPMPNPHTRVIFSFADGPASPAKRGESHLYFNDQRRFGWIKVVKGDKGNWGDLGNLGPEPLEKSFIWEILKQNLLKHKNMPVKVALMDQSVVSGVGNIYASEACFDAKIDPRTKVGDLEDRGFKAIHKGVIRVIKNGIKYGGATRVHFVDPQGHKGYFLDYAYCYGRDKHPCKVCNNLIKKITLGGRGTYFCPKCQI